MMPEEFARLGLSELIGLYDKWELKQAREDMRPAILATVIANARYGTQDNPRPFEPWDFFGSLERFRPAPPPAEDQYEALKSFVC